MKAARIVLHVASGPHAGRTFNLERHATFAVGRSPAANFSLVDDPFFSRWHFVIEANPPLCQLVDLDSRNGTKVNGVRVKRSDLRHGDVIEAGFTKLRVAMESARTSRPADAASAVSVLLARQRRAWQDGNPLRLGNLVAADPELAEHSACLLELILAEIELRRAHGEQPAVADYVGKYPKLANALPLALEGLTGSDPPDSSASQAVLDIPGYRLLGELGRGGMGIVYRAARLQDGAEFALKVLLPRARHDHATTQRFLREARILRRLRHPNIVAFRDLGEAAGILYFVMDLVHGPNASDLVRRHGPLPIAAAVTLLRQALAGLSHAHAQGYVHRDFKPANILLQGMPGEGIGAQPATSGSATALDLAPNFLAVKITDFGLARTYLDSPLSGLTLAGCALGTPQFMAPEQVRDFRSVQPAADQYAAAATLYFLLTGQAPFEACSSVQEFFKRLLEDDPMSIKAQRPDVPDALAHAIQRALAREPCQRFAGIAQFDEALEAAL